MVRLGRLLGGQRLLVDLAIHLIRPLFVERLEGAFVTQLGFVVVFLVFKEHVA